MSEIIKNYGNNTTTQEDDNWTSALENMPSFEEHIRQMEFEKNRATQYAI